MYGFFYFQELWYIRGKQGRPARGCLEHHLRYKRPSLNAANPESSSKDKKARMDEKKKKEKMPAKVNVPDDISGNYSENEYIHEFMHKDYFNNKL